MTYGWLTAGLAAAALAAGAAHAGAPFRQLAQAGAPTGMPGGGPGGPGSQPSGTGEPGMTNPAGPGCAGPGRQLDVCDAPVLHSRARNDARSGCSARLTGQQRTAKAAQSLRTV